MDEYKNSISTKPTLVGPPKVIGKIVVIKSDGDFKPDQLIKYKFNMTLACLEEEAIWPPVVGLQNWERQNKSLPHQDAITLIPAIGEYPIPPSGDFFFCVEEKIKNVGKAQGVLYKVDVVINNNTSIPGIDVEFCDPN